MISTIASIPMLANDNAAQTNLVDQVAKLSTDLAAVLAWIKQQATISYPYLEGDASKAKLTLDKRKSGSSMRPIADDNDNVDDDNTDDSASMFSLADGAFKVEAKVVTLTFDRSINVEKFD